MSYCLFACLLGLIDVCNVRLFIPFSTLFVVLSPIKLKKKFFLIFVDVTENGTSHKRVP